VTTLTGRAVHSVRGLWEIYLSGDTFARYDRRLALDTGVLLGLPIL
jgi:hypothetical protein